MAMKRTWLRLIVPLFPKASVMWRLRERLRSSVVTTTLAAASPVSSAA